MYPPIRSVDIFVIKQIGRSRSMATDRTGLHSVQLDYYSLVKGREARKVQPF